MTCWIPKWYSITGGKILAKATRARVGPRKAFFSHPALLWLPLSTGVGDKLRQWRDQLPQPPWSRGALASSLCPSPPPWEIMLCYPGPLGCWAGEVDTSLSLDNRWVGMPTHAPPPIIPSPAPGGPNAKASCVPPEQWQGLVEMVCKGFLPPPLYTAPGLMPALAMPQCALLFFAMAATGFLVCHAWKGGMERGGSGRHRGQQWMPNSSCEQIKKTPFSSLPGPWQVQGHDSDCTVVVLSPASPSPLVQPVKSKLVDTQQGVAYADSMSYVHIDMYIK